MVKSIMLYYLNTKGRYLILALFHTHTYYLGKGKGRKSILGKLLYR